MPKDTPPTPQALEGFIRQKLEGIDISPYQKSYLGMPAILATSDSASEAFFDHMQTMQPDGYIVGIGVGGILSMLESFAPNSPPKGIIMADINPYVVAAARLFTEELTFATDPQSLLRQIYFHDPQTYADQLRSIARHDRSMRRGISNWRDEALPPMLSQQEYDDTINGRWDQHTEYSTWRANTYPHIPSVIFNHFHQLQQLARCGKIAAFYTDFANPDFTSAVTSLPDFLDSTNVIYTTNSIDCHKREGTTDIQSFISLAQYDKANREPIFVAATKPSLVMKTARSFSDLQAMYASELQ